MYWYHMRVREHWKPTIYSFQLSSHLCYQLIYLRLRFLWYLCCSNALKTQLLASSSLPYQYIECIQQFSFLLIKLPFMRICHLENHNLKYTKAWWFMQHESFLARDLAHTFGNGTKMWQRGIYCYIHHVEHHGKVLPQ